VFILCLYCVCIVYIPCVYIVFILCLYCIYTLCLYCVYIISILCLHNHCVYTKVVVTLSSRPLLSTPNRFSRTSQGMYWNTGNGSPDAVCFQVDRPGIIIAGVGLYGGGGTYEYEVELLDEVIALRNLFLPLSLFII